MSEVESNDGAKAKDSAKSKGTAHQASEQSKSSASQAGAKSKGGAPQASAKPKGSAPRASDKPEGSAPQASAKSEGSAPQTGAKPEGGAPPAAAKPEGSAPQSSEPKTSVSPVGGSTVDATHSNGSSRLPWGIAIGAVVLSLLLLFQGLLPAQNLAREQQQEVARLEGELSATKKNAADQASQIDDLLKDKVGLSQEATLTKERLEQALQEKEEALAALEKAKKDLSETLGTQIAAGDVLIKEVKGELVVDVADKLLFDTGEAELNAAGEELLAQVAKSMKRLSPAQVFRVGGHTDSQRVVSKDLVERYPTNWELASARATNVVRHLQEKGGVPGRQLIAAGFSQYRPASTNKTERGRQKNRRIEIVLLRRKR